MKLLLIAIGAAFGVSVVLFLRPTPDALPFADAADYEIQAVDCWETDVFNRSEGSLRFAVQASVPSGPTTDPQITAMLAPGEHAHLHLFKDHWGPESTDSGARRQLMDAVDQFGCDVTVRMAPAGDADQSGDSHIDH